MLANISAFIPNVVAQWDTFISSIWETLLMLAWSGVFVFVLGGVLGVALTVTRAGGILENRPLWQVLDKVTNVFRSIPFIILLAALLPVSRLIMGTAIGVPGAIVPLVVGAIPFFARQVEVSLAEVDPGLIEAADAMGLAPLDIIWRVYLRESVSSLARVTTVTLISLLNLTAMAGAVGAGGLGNFAIQYGKDRNQLDVIYVTVVVLVVMVSIIQIVGNAVARTSSPAYRAAKAAAAKADDAAPSHTRRNVLIGASAVAVGFALYFIVNGFAAAPAERITVKMGVTGVIYEELYAPAKAKLAKEGIDLQIVQFSDYTTPNAALADGDIDLNSFQHRIFFATELKSKGYKLTNIANTFIQPLHLYSANLDSIDQLKAGDKVAIPDDVTNGGRALKVLESAGLIELSKDAGFNPTVEDITANPLGIEIVQLAANSIPSILPDVAAGIVNGNYAIDNNLSHDDVIFGDANLDEEQYWNLTACRTEDLKDPEKVEVYRKVIDAYQSASTTDVYNNTYGGNFIAVGWDQDLLGAAAAEAQGK